MIKKIPYMKRIKRLKKGLASQQEYNTVITEKFLDLPLKHYLINYPRDYEELINILEKYEPNVKNFTYKQTAILIENLRNANEVSRV